MCCILHQKKDNYTVIILNGSFIHKTDFWAEGSEGEGICHQAQESEFNTPDTQGRRNAAPARSHLISTHVLSYMCTHTRGQEGTYACMHTHSCINEKVKFF